MARMGKENPNSELRREWEWIEAEGAPDFYRRPRRQRRSREGTRKRHHLTPALSPALPCGGEGEASAGFDHGVSSTRSPRLRLGKGTTSPRPSPPHCPAAEREKRRPASIMECHRLGVRA